MLIGIVGLLGSGKTTLANYLVERYAYQEYSFSSPIKSIAMIFGFTYEQLYGTQAQKSAIHPELGVSAREFLQKFGTEIGREYLPTLMPTFCIKRGLWIDMFLRNYDKTIDTVVSDVRFVNEAKAIKELGGVLIYAKRDHHRSFDVESFHLSEQEIAQIECDFTIDNDVLSIGEARVELDKIISMV